MLKMIKEDNLGDANILEEADGLFSENRTVRWEVGRFYRTKKRTRKRHLTISDWLGPSVNPGRWEDSEPLGRWGLADCPAFLVEQDIHRDTKFT